MSSTMAPSQDRLGLRVLDPDLPLLASEAAIDVDNLLAGESVDRTAMRRLSQKLSESIGRDSTGGVVRSHLDIATLTVLGEAISETVEKRSLKKVEDLLSKASKIANVLAYDDPQSNREGLEQARDFCVALSRATVSYIESISDPRPSHPFRR